MFIVICIVVEFSSFKTNKKIDKRSVYSKLLLMKQTNKQNKKTYKRLSYYDYDLLIPTTTTTTTTNYHQHHHQQSKYIFNRANPNSSKLKKKTKRIQIVNFDINQYARSIHLTEDNFKRYLRTTISVFLKKK